ncbi:MAG: VCBS repeat-containing protein [Chloroflexi bacterium]|nr:VCBS repeat-containing protein [Chloroflexota bacterium]
MRTISNPPSSRLLTGTGRTPLSRRQGTTPATNPRPIAPVLWLASLLLLAALPAAASQPIISRQPTDQSLSLGATATFTVFATGTTPLSYQWQFNNVALDGATTSRLVLTNLQLTDAGEYTVAITNADGTATSQAAILDVDLTFNKIMTDPIVTDTGYNWHGQAWADYDDDGDQDVLLLTDRRGYDPIYRNNGDGTFTRVLEPSLQEVLDRGVNELDVFYGWADYDNDGDLDLFVPDWSAFFGRSGKNVLFGNNGDGTFTQITNSPPATEGSISIYGGWGDFDRDGDLDLVVANGGGVESVAKNWFYLNEGGGSFIKIQDAARFPFLAEPAYYVVPVWVDVNDDGWQDLFIVAWPSGINHLYLNNGVGAFTKVTGDPIVSESNAWGGPAWADYDNDGDLDLFLTTGGRFFETGPVRLYRNDGTGRFASMSVEDVGSLLSEGAQSYSCAWGDYDNDGWIDLYVANGWRGAESRPDLLYRNKGDGTFTKVTRGSPSTEKGAGMSANWVDIDNDGSLDLFIAKHPEPDNSLNRLYRNNGNSNSWLCVKCVGTTSPRSGTGAKVRVKATIRGKSMWQLRPIDAGGWSWGGQSFVAHFGLGDATVVATLRIEWTSGIVQELKNVTVNQYVTVTEPPKVQGHPLQLTGVERQADGSLEIRWTGEAPPYQLQSRASLSEGEWQNEGAPTEASSATLQNDAAAKFFRVRSLFGETP